MTVAELLDRMSSREFSEWMAFDQIEPFGDDWRQTGLLASLTANTNRDPKKRKHPYEIEDFMPVAKDPTEEQEVEAVTPSLDPEQTRSSDAKDGATLARRFDVILGGKAGG